MAIIGYIRVSSIKQSCEHQRFEIKKFMKQNNMAVDKWVAETISSRKPLHKRALGLVLPTLQDGDILICSEISRLGRSILEIMRILENCLSKNCQVWTIKENYRLGNDLQSKVMAFAFGLSAEIERNLISQRTKSSLANLKSTGKKLGRPIAWQTQQLKLRRNKEIILELLQSGAPKVQIARRFGVTPMTLRRFLVNPEQAYCFACAESSS